VSLTFGVLGLVFFWWVPMGILLGFCGLVAGLIGWAMSPRRAGAIGMLLWGVVLSAAVLCLDVIVALRNLETLQIHAFW
jgi:hypothetical protein